MQVQATAAAAQRVGVAFGVMLVVLGAWVSLNHYDPSVGSVPTIDPACTQAPLRVHAEWTLMRHQNWFEAPVAVGSAAPYLILNVRTRQAYRWSALQEPAGTRFEVQTRWVLFHANWGEDPWLLLYNC